jgi:hypothetical protein
MMTLRQGKVWEAIENEFRLLERLDHVSRIKPL